MICFKTVQRYEEKCELQSGDCKILLKLKRFCLYMSNKVAITKRNPQYD